MRQRAAALAIAIAVAGPAAADVTMVDHVSFASRDGVQLKGTYWSPGGPGPGVVLFHQCDGAGRQSWGSVPRALAGAGFHVLTFDNRGVGESAHGREAPNTIAGDADAAYSWLAWQPGVDKTRMAAMGSSCGVGSATNLTIAHPDVRALVLISGGVGSNAMAQIKKTPTIAIFGVGATGDPMVANLPDAVRISTHALSTMKRYEGSVHGVALLLKDRELSPAIVRWLQSVMK
jgi:dienelactone hydrolase